MQILHFFQLITPVEDTHVVNNVSTLEGIEVLFNNIVAVVIGFAGVALFIMLIVGGIKYITAGGDPKKAASASKTLTYAIGGLALVALALLILTFIARFTGIGSILNFRIRL
jgi:hypothetical protein